MKKVIKNILRGFVSLWQEMIDRIESLRFSLLG